MTSERRIRIGITGAPSVGKTTLATALAERLGVPCLPEEMRAYLEQTGPLRGRPPAEIERVLRELWQTRALTERATRSFVADNSCLDFAAYAVFYDCLDGESLASPPELLAGPIAHAADYDAIILLPCGVLPYVRDGVRPDSPYQQLRYHVIVEGLLRRYADARRLHVLPDHVTSPEARLAWALDIARAIERADARTPSGAARGTVYLVGAGPGDPGLLTVRARELLATADVIAHDSLVPPELLALAGPRAELVPVGRRHGAGPTTYRVHPAVLEHHRAGRSVVRLKAGDPLLFGRGAEEAEELVEAGIPFEIVPGISAALGAAAYASIPLTHRRWASDVTFASGHDAEGEHPSRTAWATTGGGTGTLVLYMAVRTLAANMQRLIDAGRSPETPAAYIAEATTPRQVVITGTLATLAALTQDIDPKVPALIIVGDVVSVRARIAAFDARATQAPASTESVPAAVPAPVRGLVLVYTGQGKGKTTAALGVVFRALGRGMRVAVVQFIKGKWKTGERLFAATLPGLTFLVMGTGFTWNSDDLGRDRAAAVAAWATSRKLIASGAEAIVVLDELTYAINYGFVEITEVVAALRDRPPHVHVIVTGRNAPAEICEIADLVTDMKAVKHPFEHGVKAQLGVDY